MRRRIWIVAAAWGLLLTTAGCQDGGVPVANAGANDQAATPKATQAKSGSETKAKAAGTKRPVVVVSYNPLMSGRLAGELIRQSVIAVAREDAGMIVRDGGLDDPLPTDAPDYLQIDLQMGQSQGMFGSPPRREGLPPSKVGEGPKGIPALPLLEITRRNRVNFNQPAPREHLELPYAGKIRGVLSGNTSDSKSDQETRTELEITDLEGVATAAATLNDDLKAFLVKAADSPATPAAATDDSDADTGDIELRLREMSLVSQFEAVRAAHLLPPGATKDRLLAVGYANLGLLTQHHWSQKWKVFSARGIVYGLRFAESEPGPLAEEIQAYTTALAGMHAVALKHIEAAGDATSPRLRTLDAFCRMRHDELLKLSKRTPEVHELAAVLACVAVDGLHSEADQAGTYAAGIEANADCYRLYDCAFQSSLIGLGHDATVRGPSQLMQSLPRRLSAVAGLPPAVKEVLDDEDLLPATLADRLEAAPHPTDTPVEPTWNLLGRLIRDESLVMAYRRLQFLDDQLGLPTSEEYEMFRAMVGEHPLAAALEAHADAPEAPKVQAAFQEWMSMVPDVPGKNGPWSRFHDFGPRVEAALLAAVRVISSERFHFSAAFPMTNSYDWVADDLVPHLFIDRHNFKSMRLEPRSQELALWAVSPHHPVRALLRMNSRTVTDEELAACETEYADRPALLTFLAKIRTGREQYDDALRVATRVTETSPTFEAYRALAEARKGLGHTDEYVAAMEAAFELPTYGLTVARARMELAYHYMSQGDFEAAEPHAVAAAETYASWAMDCAVDCYTGLEEWDKAEAWIVQKIRRYPGCETDWYAWCRWTGHGHEDEAKAYAEASLSAHSVPLRPVDKLAVPELLQLAGFALISGNDNQAGDLRAFLAEQEQNPAGALAAGVAYLRAGRRDDAVAILAKGRTWTTLSEKAPAAAMRAGIFHDAFASDTPLTPEVIRALDEAVDTFAVHERIAFRAYYGDLLVRLGNREEGLALLERAASPHVAHEMTPQMRNAQAYAGITLREHRAAEAARLFHEESAGRDPVEAPRP